MSNEMRISDILKELGVSPNVIGYLYLIYGIEEMTKDQSLMYAITKRLYPLVAQKFDATAARVERSIRHAIEKGWCRGNMKMQEKLFGYTVDMNKGKPTNSEFMCTVADYFNMTQCEQEV